MTNTSKVVIGAIGFGILLKAFQGQQSILGRPTDNFKIRGCDSKGCGHYGASRGSRLHQGIDIEVKEGQAIKSPITGTFHRYSLPYSSDISYKGLELRGSGEYEGIKIKIWYMIPSLNLGQTVTRGQKIGVAQNIAKKYPDANGNYPMTNHVHLQMYENGSLVDPTPYFKV